VRCRRGTGLGPHPLRVVDQHLLPPGAPARGQLHTIKHPCRDGARRKVVVIGERADGQYFEAEFDWGETLDTYDGVLLDGVPLSGLR
jgi:hypothetical protein